MRITDVRITDGQNKNILARISIILDDMVAIHGLAVMPGHKGGLHLSFPRHLHKDGSRRDTVHPINTETRAYIERIVFDAYHAKNPAS